MRRIALVVLTSLAVVASMFVVAAPASAVSTGTVSGHASRQGSSDASNLFVTLVPQTPDATHISTGTGAAGDGSWSISVNPGNWTILVQDGSTGHAWVDEYWDSTYAPSAATYLPVVAGADLTGYDMQLELGGTLTVHVVGGPS